MEDLLPCMAKWDSRFMRLAIEARSWTEYLSVVKQLTRRTRQNPWDPCLELIE